MKLSRGKHQDEKVSGNEVAESVLDKLQHDQRKLLHSMSKVIYHVVALGHRPIVCPSRNDRCWVDMMACVQVAPDPKRPRILVAAPSNAAVDLLVQRIMQKQFFDRGGMYMNWQYCWSFFFTKTPLDVVYAYVCVERDW